MIVITAGKKYLDIDAYASGIAYSILLKSMGAEAVFTSSAKFNMSICPTIKNLGFVLDDYKPSYEDKFIVIDLSNPDFFDEIVDLNRVIEIIDHHTGFEDLWKKNSNCRSQIEFIGSVATIIYEKFVEAGKEKLLSKDLCKLLISAILDNTLNLKSDITSQRDLTAYQHLQKLGGVDTEFDKEYFSSCQEYINKDLSKAITSDIKIEEVSPLLPKVFGQLTIYDKTTIFSRFDEINKIFECYNQSWMLNIICLKDGKSYIFTTDKTAQQGLEKLFEISFDKNLLILPKFKLRKEIMKFARKKTS